MTEAKSVCVLGGGNAAHAIAADLALRGWKVNMCELPEFKEGTFKKTLETGKIEVSGLIEGTANLNLATTDFGEAIKGTDIIFIAVPAFGHQTMAERCAPYLEDKHVVVIISGNCASLVLAKVLRDKGLKKEIAMAETVTPPYAARLSGPGEVVIIGKLSRIPLGVFPAKRTNEVVELMKGFYPEILPVSNILECCLNFHNAAKHAPPMLLNMGRINEIDESYIYGEGVHTSSIQFSGRLTGTIMNETAKIGRVLGFDLPSGDNLIEKGLEGRRQYVAGHFSEKIKDTTKFLRPLSTNHRFITEDVPYGLVLQESLGNMFDIKMPVTSSVIELFSVINQIDYRAEGRTVDKLGIAGMSAAKLNKFLYDGE